jgi:hypothetical protein
MAFKEPCFLATRPRSIKYHSATPGLADGQGCSAALHPKGDEIMAALKFIDINGKRFLWRELLHRRREQVAAAAKAEQPVLFEMKQDCRPASERTAAGRYSQPNLFDSIGQ